MAERSFWPTVAGGLGSAALAAVGSAQEWAHADGTVAGLPTHQAVSGSDAVPLAPALSLVVLASWGALLVLRRRARRALAVVGTVAAATALLTLVLGAGDAQRAARQAALGGPDSGGSAVGHVAVHLGAWYPVTGVALALTLAALVVAVHRSSRWPAMGSRYDSPVAAAEGDREGDPSPAASPDGAGRPDDRGPEGQDEGDLWRAQDEGRDPTV